MSDWNSLVQLLMRAPGIIAWMIAISAAFLFHLRRPGPATVAQIGGSLLAFLASGFSLFAQTMMQVGLRSPGGTSSLESWGTLLWTASFVHQAGMLLYAVALLAALSGLPRPERG